MTPRLPIRAVRGLRESSAGTRESCGHAEEVRRHAEAFRGIGQDFRGDAAGSGSFAGRSPPATGG